MHSDGFYNDLELQRTIWKRLKKMHSDTIWNDLELQVCVFLNNVSKARILTVFEKIWNCREIDESNVTKACIVTGFETS